MSETINPRNQSNQIPTPESPGVLLMQPHLGESNDMYYTCELTRNQYDSLMMGKYLVFIINNERFGFQLLNGTRLVFSEGLGFVIDNPPISNRSTNDQNESQLRIKRLIINPDTHTIKVETQTTLVWRDA
jgi:hypothetical protein